MPRFPSQIVTQRVSIYMNQVNAGGMEGRQYAGLTLYETGWKHGSVQPDLFK